MRRREKGSIGKLNKDQGSAMIVALVVSVVIMVLCLSLIMITYTLFTQTSRRSGQAQCKEIAQSFAESIEKEVEDPDSLFVRYLNERIQTTIPERYWCPIDSSEETDPKYSEDAISQLDLSITEIEGYTIYVSMTYEMVDNSDSEEDIESSDPDTPEAPGSSDPSDAGDPRDPDTPSEDPPAEPNYPLATIMIKCIKGSDAVPDPLYYSTTIHANIPIIEL